MIKLLKYSLNKKVSSPVYLIHFLTNRCNAKCPHCFVPINQGDELAFNEIEKVIKSFSKDIFNVNLTGGEPFLRDDIPDIVRLYRDAGVRSVLIASNGSLVEEIKQSTRTILAKHDDMKLTISLSIDHIGDKHDRLRGIPGLYQRVINLYHELSTMNKRLSVQANITVQQDNQHEIESIITHLVDKEKISNINLAVVRHSQQIDYQNYFNACRLIDSYSEGGRLDGYRNGYLSVLNAKNRISRRMIEKTIKENRYLTPCFAGSLSGVLSANGDVYPCELSREKIGNVKDFDYNFKALWTSDKADKIRKQIAETKCFCTHECNWTVNILFNPRYYLRLLK